MKRNRLSIKRVVDLYVNKRMTLRMVAEELNTNHHMIKRILVRRGVEITQSRRIRKPFTDAHRKKISESSKGRPCYWKGKKMGSLSLYKNMVGHLKYDVTLEWLQCFSDIEKLKYLNKSITRKRDCLGFTTETYKLFIDRFYNDLEFNRLYDLWLSTNNKWIKPSLDHIYPKSKGSELTDIDNLRFVSWFENRAKADIPQDEWNQIKLNIGYYL